MVFFLNLMRYQCFWTHVPTLLTDAIIWIWQLLTRFFNVMFFSRFLVCFHGFSLYFHGFSFFLTKIVDDGKLRSCNFFAKPPGLMFLRSRDVFWGSLTIICNYLQCLLCIAQVCLVRIYIVFFSGCLYNSGIDSSRVYQLHGLQGWGNLSVASVCFLGEPQDLSFFDDIIIAKGNSRYLKMPTIESWPILIEMSRVNWWAQFLPVSHFLNRQCFSAWNIE